MFQFQPLFPNMVRAGAKILAIAAYAIALLFGFLCVLYHLVFIMLSYQLTGQLLPYLFGYGGLLLVANLIYPVSIMAMLTARSWRARIYKPVIWLSVLLLIPVIIYLNYWAVKLILPYDYSS